MGMGQVRKKAEQINLRLTISGHAHKLHKLNSLN